MTAHWQNKKEQFIIYIKTWIDDVIKNRRWNSFVDLHIDAIDTEFKNEKTWVKGSLFLFNDITALIDQSLYEIVLVIPLSCTSKASDLSTLNLDELEKELDITPPSFYLFEKRNKNFESTLELAIYLNRISEELKFKVYYKEERMDNEYYRTLYLRNC